MARRSISCGVLLGAVALLVPVGPAYAATNDFLFDVPDVGFWDGNGDLPP